MKILITYACAGIGHKKAAEAIQNALSNFNEIEVTPIDVLDYTNAFLKFLYPRVYLFLINRTPLLWGLLYYFSDSRLVDRFLAPVRKFSQNLHAKNFIKFVLEEKPDVIVCTHFLPSEIISGLKRKNIFKGKLITVVTDFLVHSFWIIEDSDYFIAAIERTKKDLVRRGIKEERIEVLGIPCDPIFSISKGREDLIKKLGMEQDFFNLLIMSGGFGTGPIREIISSIRSLEPEIRNRIQLIVICGKNKSLFEELNRLKLDLEIRLYVFGYMNNIDEFMEVSDCIITKSGGLTISESLSKKLPMIIIQPIPGQETRNCKVLTDFGTAVRANTVGQARDFIRDFIIFPEKTIGMKARINLLSYPDAAKNIARFIVEGGVRGFASNIEHINNEN